jgi:hypothetical protein
LMGVDDGVRQAVGAVEVLGGVAFGVGLGDEVALVVVAGRPGAAVGIGDCGDQWGLVVVLVAGGAAERVGLGDEARVLVVFQGDAAATGQFEAGHIAGAVEVDAVVLAAEVAAGDDAAVVVVVDLGLAPEGVGDAGGARGGVVVEAEVLAVAGGVLGDPGLAGDVFPAVDAGQLVAHHEAVFIGEAADGVAVAVDDFAELARRVVVQVQADAAAGGDVLQAAAGVVGEDAVAERALVLRAVKNWSRYPGALLISMARAGVLLMASLSLYPPIGPGRPHISGHLYLCLYQNILRGDRLNLHLPTCS